MVQTTAKETVAIFPRMRYGNRVPRFDNLVGGSSMARKAVKLLLVALFAAFAVSSVAEAAPVAKKVVRHRTKHSSRVSSGAAASGSSATTAKKPSTTAKKSGGSGSSNTSSKPAPKASAKRAPSTKPR
jgi:hypothetical protein